MKHRYHIILAIKRTDWAQDRKAYQVNAETPAEAKRMAKEYACLDGFVVRRVEACGRI